MTDKRKTRAAMTIAWVLLGLWLFVLSPLHRFSATVLEHQPVALWSSIAIMILTVSVTGIFAARKAGMEALSHLWILFFVVSAFSYQIFEQEIKNWIAVDSGYYSEPIPLNETEGIVEPPEVPYSRPTLNYTLDIYTEWEIKPLDSQGHFSTIEFKGDTGKSLEIRAQCLSPTSMNLAESAYKTFKRLNRNGNYRKTCFTQDAGNHACLIAPAQAEFESGRYVWLSQLSGEDRTLGASIEVLLKRPDSRIRNQLLNVFSSIRPQDKNKDLASHCITTASWL